MKHDLSLYTEADDGGIAICCTQECGFDAYLGRNPTPDDIADKMREHLNLMYQQMAKLS